MASTISLTTATLVTQRELSRTPVKRRGPPVSLRSELTIRKNRFGREHNPHLIQYYPRSNFFRDRSVSSSSASFFRMDPNLVRELAHREWSRAEVLVTLGLHAVAQGAPKSHQTFGTGDSGEPTLEVPFTRTRLLETLGFVRTRERSEVPHDFPGNDWRFATRGLNGLESKRANSVSRLDRTRALNVDRFPDFLQPPVTRRSSLTAAYRNGGFTSILVPFAVFALRVSSNALRLSLWLTARHRGARSKKHGFQHSGSSR